MGSDEDTPTTDKTVSKAEPATRAVNIEDLRLMHAMLKHALEPMVKYTGDLDGMAVEASDVTNKNIITTIRTLESYLDMYLDQPMRFVTS